MLTFTERQKLGERLLEIEQQIRSWVLWHPNGMDAQIENAIKYREELREKIRIDQKERAYSNLK